MPSIKKICVVDNLSELSTLSGKKRPLVYVRSVGDMWRFDPTSLLPVDAITVVEDKWTTGRYLRQLEPDARWAWREQWYIDGQLGDDEADGGSPGRPIKTIEELRRRVPEQARANVVDVSWRSPSVEWSLS